MLSLCLSLNVSPMLSGPLVQYTLSLTEGSWDGLQDPETQLWNKVPLSMAAGNNSFQTEKLPLDGDIVKEK